MEKSANQVEKNVSASFGYVKKDMLMLNDAFSDLNDKVQHLSMNQASLLEELKHLRIEVEKLTGRKEIKNMEEKDVKKEDKSKKVSKKN